MSTNRYCRECGYEDVNRFNFINNSVIEEEFPEVFKCHNCYPFFYRRLNLYPSEVTDQIIPLTISEIIEIFGKATIWNKSIEDFGIQIPIEVPKCLDNVFDQFNYDQNKLSLKAYIWNYELKIWPNFYEKFGDILK